MPCCTWLSLAQPCGWWPVAWCWSAGAHSSLEPHRPVPGGPPRPPCGAPHDSLHCPEALGAVQTAVHEPCSAGPVAPQPTGEMCSSDQFGDPWVHRQLLQEPGRVQDSDQLDILESPSTCERKQVPGVQDPDSFRLDYSWSWLHAMFTL